MRMGETIKEDVVRQFMKSSAVGMAAGSEDA